MLYPIAKSTVRKNVWSMVIENIIVVNSSRSIGNVFGVDISSVVLQEPNGAPKTAKENTKRKNESEGRRKA